METYIILTKLSPDAFHDPSELSGLAKQVTAKIKSECSDVVWKESYAIMGRFDVMDIIEAPSREAAERAALVIRAYGHATTETMAATPWKQFIASLQAQHATAVA